MSRFLAVGALAALSLSGCCHPGNGQPDPPCWKDTQGFVFTIPDAGAESIAGALRSENADRCRELLQDEAAAKTLDRAVWAADCNDAYASYVLRSYCGEVGAPSFCAARCPSDPSCQESGRATVVRNCGAASLGQFQSLYGYCAGLKLQGTQLVPVEGQGPRCPR